MAINTPPTPSPIGGESRVDPLGSLNRIPWKRVNIIAAVVLIAGAFIYTSTHSTNTEEGTEKSRSYRTTVVDRIFPKPEPAIELPEPVVEPVVVEPPAEEQEQEQTPPPPRVETRTIVVYKPRPLPAIPRVRSSRSTGKAFQVVSTTGTSGNTDAPQSADVANTSSNVAASGGAASDGVTRGYATKLQNTDRLLTQNTNIPCTLHNALNTQLAGDVTCSVAENIYSADNSRILVAKGSQANGKYQIETTSSAVTRIGVIWGRIRTTDDMVALLDSGTTDQQGASGIPADTVNYHLWEKYGTAFAISMVEGALRNIGRNDSSADVVVNSATGVSSDIASQILAASINMPTTREVLPGKQIIIHLQGDIEFEPLS